MQSLAERLAALPADERAALLKTISNAEAEALLHDWRGFLARPNQIAPEGDWTTWLILAGRGFGKSRTGAEWVREEEQAGRATRIALVGETAKDTRDVMVEGPSGLLAVYPPDQRPLYEPSKARVTFQSGAVATLFNATEPNQLRGPQFDCAWCDELAKWRHARETWDMLQFGLRLGMKPRQIVTTTPRPIDLVKEMIRDPHVHVTRGSTFDNTANLAPSFMETMRRLYEGSRLGRQELNAEVLEDVAGALWPRVVFDRNRKPAAPQMERVLVAVDPAVSSTEKSDEHGIMVGGMGEDQRGYLIEDASLRGTPLEWARRAVAMFDRYEADGVVVEVNQGGDMVAQTLRSVRDSLPIIEVRARKGKHVRAEPIAALYEQDRISHIGAFPDLEDQMALMTVDGFQGDGSPDRCDAAVWLFTELFPSIISRPERVDHMDLIRAAAGGWMGR